MSLKEKICSSIVILIGFLSMVGTVTSLDAIRGLGFMSTASPLPLVFSKFRGVENFSSDYFMDVTYVDGENVSFQITDEMYEKTSGPYNRRNPYGAVLAYGPMLDRPNEILLRNSVMEYSACGQGTFMKELGLKKEIRHIKVTLKSKTKQKPEWQFEVNCLKGKSS